MVDRLSVVMTEHLCNTSARVDAADCPTLSEVIRHPARAMRISCAERRRSGNSCATCNQW
jgi:hypothetical protein